MGKKFKGRKKIVRRNLQNIPGANGVLNDGTNLNDRFGAGQKIKYENCCFSQLRRGLH